MNMTSDYRDPLIDLLNNSVDSPQDPSSLSSNHLNINNKIPSNSSSDDLQFINRNNGYFTNGNLAATNNSIFNNNFQQYHQQQQQQLNHLQQAHQQTDYSQSLTPLLNHHSLYDLDSNNINHLRIQELEDSPPQINIRQQQEQQQKQQQQQQQQAHQSNQQQHENQHQQQNSSIKLEQPTGRTPLFDPENGHDLQLFNNNNFSKHGIDFAFPEMKPLTSPFKPLSFDINLSNNHLQSQTQHQHQQPQIGPVPPPSKRKKDSTASKTRPAFVMKIWSMVNDKSNDEYIRWNEDGKTFQVFKREDFVHKILPAYFKHQNMSSFVRQLNMYGFHKVQDISNGTLHPNCDKNGGDEVWQFENPNFIKGREDLLEHIVRNKSVSHEENQLTDTNQSSNEMSLLLSELNQIKQNQARLNEEIVRIRQDNQNIYNANFITRERAKAQEVTINKILKFLAAVYNDNAPIKAQSQPPEDLNDINNHQLSRQYNNNSVNHKNNNVNNNHNHDNNNENEILNPTYQSPSSSSTSSFNPIITKKRKLLLENRPSITRSRSSPTSSIESIKEIENQLDNHWINMIANQSHNQSQQNLPNQSNTTTQSSFTMDINDHDENFNVDDFIASPMNMTNNYIPPFSQTQQQQQSPPQQQQQPQSNNKKRSIREIHENNDY
ncbi:CTA8 [Candida jiufengensis]|uniref:CTA8 n=1 Tax=Candida jiufengensis TaxID=497108 RepID=UPI0022257EED|nr:CTA8 [Candida jiufengensis]KAI5954664.1 CTA8 [Candida jiufengensis]